MFTHLHVHTEYSLLDGLCNIPQMVQRAKELGMHSIAITDHGNLYGLVDFYKACKDAKIKPIIGCEMYVAPGSHTSKTPGDKQPFHMTMIAKNNAGYHNLLRLVTKAQIDGFYYRPRVDRELLEQYKEGLIVFSGCLNGEIPRMITSGRLQEARDVARWYAKTFPGNFYLELQRHPAVPGLDEVNAELLVMAKELDLPLVATNDFHYINRQDAEIQDLLICIHTNTTVKDEKRLKMDSDSFHLASPQEMEELFADVPEAIANTERIAKQCDVQLEFGTPRLPHYDTPNGEDADTYLHRLCMDGLQRRLPNATPEYHKRLAYELEVVKKTHFADYFLVVWEIAHWTRGAGIMFGVRGSAAASLVLYCLGVTDVDPMPYKLVFERFLNLERKEMPDIDMDFQDDRRDEVLKHIVDHYGTEHVAQIVTFGTMGPKAALRDTGRALGMTYGDVDRVARLVPFRAKTLTEALEMVSELQDLANADPDVQTLITKAQRLEGVVHHVSTHAAGVVISKDPLVETVPLQRPVRTGTSELAMTQYAMDPIAQLGLLKMDVLGLANLTILKRAVEAVQQNQGIAIDVHKIPLDDAKTFAMLAQGETSDLFQLESAGMRRYIKQLKPTLFTDLVAMVALYRPGPMEHIPQYIAAKHQEIEVTHPHPVLKEILEDTYGVIVYQDQVLFIVRAFAGYSLGQADIVRKAMGKKIAEVMQKERERFVAGALKQGFSQEEADSVFNLILPFAGYAFNKAHSVSYALLAYWTAYFKANFPVEYMLAVLNTRAENLERVAIAVTECHRLGIPVLPPDINRSGVEFAIENMDDGNQAIRFGLAVVKNVGESWVKTLVDARKDEAFSSVGDFFRKIDRNLSNRRTLESIAKVGAFDALGVERSAVLASLDQLMAVAQRETKLRKSGQTSMFDAIGAEEPAAADVGLAAVAPVPAEEKRAWEQELLGVAITDNPLIEMIAELKPRFDAEGVITLVGDIDPEANGQPVQVFGQVMSVRENFTREKKAFLIANLKLIDGELEAIAWPNTYDNVKRIITEGALVQITGKVRNRDDRFSIICEEAKRFDPDAAPMEAAQVRTAPMPTAATAVAEAPATYNGNGKSNGNGHNGANGHSGSGNGKYSPSGGQHVPSVPKAIRTVVLRLQETDRPLEDEAKLREAIKSLLDHVGQDRVFLEVQQNAGKRVRLETPFHTGYSAELQAALEATLGPTAVLVEEAVK